MRIKAVVAAIAVAGGVWAVPTDQAAAQGLFDLLFGSPSYREPAWDRHERLRERYERRSRRERSGWGVRRAPPQVRVSSPSYYTYKPDPLVTASFDELAQVKVASADDSAVPATPFAHAADHLAGWRLRMPPEVEGAIRAHYSEHPAFIWITDGRVNDRARAVLAVLARAAEVGLEPRDYAVEVPSGPVAAPRAAAGDAGTTIIAPEDGGPAPQADEDVLDEVASVLAAANGEAGAAALVRFEITLSAKALTYALDAERGRVDPNRISGYHDIARKAVDLDAAMRFLAATPDVGAWLEGRSPTNPKFRALAAKLAALRDEDDGNRVEIAPGTFLKPGAADDELANVVAAIKLRGSDALKAEHAATLNAYADGSDYTPELVALVRDFQDENGLKVDGIVGPNTIAAMVEDTVATKTEKVILAMERARWLPRYLGARNVFINQPAFTATYSEAGKEPLSMRVVVGQKANQTNFFFDEVEIVEYNPYWGVPYSIIVNEMVPELSRDPSYLDRLGYEVTTQSGRRISSRAVDWYGVATKQVPINVRQPPGPRNALGEVKILFPNDHDIYMHDTPHKNLFEKDSRAFSHGCIRLQDPKGMAAAVLGKTPDYITARIAEGRNMQEKVSGKIPVYVAYFTAWPTPQGEVMFYHDVYDRDLYLRRALQATDEARATS